MTRGHSVFWHLNALLLFLTAPFLAVILACSHFAAVSPGLYFPAEPLTAQIAELAGRIDRLGESAAALGMLAQEQEDTFAHQDTVLSGLAQRSEAQRKLSDDIYEQKILAMLGPAVAAHLSDRVEIKVFRLNELGYRGYIAKVKLFDPTAFRVVLPKDGLGSKETTSAAAGREGAILAINGGGFYNEVRNGSNFTRLIGNTVIDGRLVEPFNGYPGDLFFAGINRQGQVIGTVPQSEAELIAIKPYQGVSFIPVLLKRGEKTAIPSAWANAKQPRTIIGKYANDDLILIVIDGRQGDWSVGVTLELLQDKLLTLGVKEAYNLDGGGSSAMYYNGQILNRPSDGRERPVANNIVVLP